MIYPDCDMKRWETCDNSVVLANAEYYYTKQQTEKLIQDVSGVTSGDVQTMIDDSIRTKADKSEVNELAEQVRQNADAILQRYTKTEVNSLLQSYYTKMQTDDKFAKYSKVDGVTLSLNDENIGI